MTAPSEKTAAEPCPRCGSRSGLIWVHGHGQCTTCGSNIHDCCQGAECDLAPGTQGPGTGSRA